MLSPSLEDYLEEVYRFSVIQDVVRVSDISHKLNFALPSVSKALGKLRARGYITYPKYGFIGLTDKGRQMGSYLVSRNQVLQDFFVLLRAPCDVTAEAEAMEHYLSREAIDSIQLLMAFMRENTEVYQCFVDYTNEHNKKG